MCLSFGIEEQLRFYVCLIRRDLERGTKRENQKNESMINLFHSVCFFFVLLLFLSIVWYGFFLYSAHSEAIPAIVIIVVSVFQTFFKQYSTHKRNIEKMKGKKTHTHTQSNMDVYFGSTVFCCVHCSRLRRCCRSLTNTPNRSLNLCIMFSFV